MRVLLVGSVLLVSVPLASAAHAQTESDIEDSEPAISITDPEAQASAELNADSAPRPTRENGRDIYAPEAFSRFNPRSALDMVQQIPGFTISGSDANERGLGQAQQNVLINGQRISGKTNDAETALSRINASAVERLEILDGATLNIAGLSGQVLNLVVSRQGLTGNFSWNPVLRQRLEDDWFSGEVSVSGKLGKADYTITVENDGRRQGGFGPELITGPDGELLFTRDEIARFYSDRPALTLFYGRTSDAGSIFNFNGRFQIQNFSTEIDTIRSQEGIPDILEPFRSAEDERNFEISADYDFALAGGRLKLIGFQRYEHSPTIDEFRRIPGDGNPATGSLFDQTADEGESIARAEYGWRSKNGNDWQIAAEGAFNFLDIEAELFSLDPNGEFVPAPLDNATSRVEEVRGEIILTYGRRLAPNLTLQSNFGAEYSELSQTGEFGLTRSFVRPKGSVALTWNTNANLDLNFTLERNVGQLNFFDFIAQPDLGNEVDNGGNPQLVPEQNWNFEVEAQQSLGSLGNMNLRLFYTLISDIVDRVPISDTLEAPGNLDSAWRLGAELNGTLLFDDLGIPGARLDVGLFWQTSRVDDPLTGVSRRINDDRIYTIDLNFRHDVPDTEVAWGAFLFRRENSSGFRLDLRSLSFETKPDLGMFFEHKNVAGMTARLNVSNLLGLSDGFLREFSEGRRDGPIAFTERRERAFGQIVSLDLTGTF
ncbi:TonB-dependent receptor plug domain-containing protein [Alterisphingorhabdus coralli]|uniref:TonB-dependent receptor plug domain-containing protein n=1 Tax=Alterisphingorhabdus coralli TaxID=3071408 RepID=A0AA97F8C8_9SPHN|nr:TonB-dependent receptor [Parasphingorhabdus sp. SCSIO 66989]WOE75157.1 TonB-dependent receptor plug domain-containing protein [Parasphingorhabdus sp. SCSIO 66989]